MSVLPKTLLLDIGNSRIKYAVCTGARIGSPGWLTDLEQLRSIVRDKDKVLLAAVGQSALVKEIVAMTDTLNKPCQRLESSAEAFGLHSGYDEPQRLGVDRWLAMLGGRQVTGKAFAVMDFGTATTCDFVDADGRHLGGWITPGLALMRRSLLQNTEKVFGRDSGWSLEELGNNTLDGVDTGCLALACGLVQRAEDYLRRHFSAYELLLCGGDHQLVGKKLSIKTSSHPDLVFRGMALYA